VDRNRELDNWLARHIPVDSTESGHLHAMRDLLASPGDALVRDRYRPGHFTASAIVLPPDGDALLLIHHTRLRRWLQPGGHVENADGDLALAARREAAEETGVYALDAPVGEPLLFDLDVHRIPASGGTPAHRHFDVRFLFRARSRDLTPASDVSEARWVPFSEVTELNGEESMIRLIRKLDTLLASAEGHAFQGEPR